MSLTTRYINIVYAIMAVLCGMVIDVYVKDRMDYWIHDSAMLYQVRTEWLHSVIVVLDDDVPYSVGRKQALPLFALATDRMVKAGAKGVFLDARISKQMAAKMPYAQCMQEAKQVVWSEPQCISADQQQCLVVNSEAGNAPLKMSAKAIQHFSIAPYFDAQANLPDFLLYGWESAMSIPETGLQVSDRVVTRDNPVARWLDLSKDSAVHRMVTQLAPDNQDALYSSDQDKICNQRFPCRRVRLSLPISQVQTEGKQLLLPVSKLAACDQQTALETAALAKDRVVILQTTSPTEQTDRLITPMTTALFSPGQLTPGSQFIADEIETILNQDHPRAPNLWVKLALFIFLAALSVYLTVRKPALLGLVAIVVFLALLALCLLNPLIQLWPVFAGMMVFLTAAGQSMTVNLLIGLKEGRLIKQYMPKQIHNLLFSLKASDSFRNKRCYSIVLMSDLAGYTTLTGLLKEPDLILDLMNDYLSETAFVVQDKYNGWFESYIGDMVCYYWPFDEKDEKSFANAVKGALELSRLQDKFFAELPHRYEQKLDDSVLGEIKKIIDAGIGLSVGEVVMGNLGPKNGVQKFGILGDPLNLVSRVESLTRFFNTDIIVTKEFLPTIENNGFVVRRLGLMKVKGRIEPEMLYALGEDDGNDERFMPEHIAVWEKYLLAVEEEREELPVCPAIYEQDRKALAGWLSRNLLEDKVWKLDEK